MRAIDTPAGTHGHARTCVCCAKARSMHTRAYTHTHTHTHTHVRALTHTHTRLSTKITHAHPRLRSSFHFSRYLYNLSQCTHRAAVLGACVITDQSHVATSCYCPRCQCQTRHKCVALPACARGSSLINHTSCTRGHKLLLSTSQRESLCPRRPQHAWPQADPPLPQGNPPGWSPG